MSTDRGLSELMTAVVEWALANGGEGAHSRPGLWCGETVGDEHEGSLTVELNPHMEDVDGISPATARITPADKMGKIAVAIVNPYGGSLSGFSEDALISHFRGQPS